jgi:hypothetical protein
MMTIYKNPNATKATFNWMNESFHIDLSEDLFPGAKLAKAYAETAKENGYTLWEIAETFNCVWDTEPTCSNEMADRAREEEYMKSEMLYNLMRMGIQ